MDSHNYGASGAFDEEDAANGQAASAGPDGGAGDAEERLGEELAEFAFMREEDEGEVRLSFRDVPADSIAAAFRRAGALFLSLTGERLRVTQPTPVRPAVGMDEAVEEEVQPLGRRKRRRRGDNEERERERDGRSEQVKPQGELIMRYFYATEDLVYTVIIATSTGMVKSIAGVYPSAQLLEREVRDRLGVVVR